MTSTAPTILGRLMGDEPDPFPLYDELRETGGGVHAFDPLGWFVTRYDDVAAIGKDNATFSSEHFWDSPAGHPRPVRPGAGVVHGDQRAAVHVPRPALAHPDAHGDDARLHRCREQAVAPDRRGPGRHAAGPLRARPGGGVHGGLRRSRAGGDHRRRPGRAGVRTVGVPPLVAGTGRDVRPRHPGRGPHRGDPRRQRDGRVPARRGRRAAPRAARRPDVGAGRRPRRRTATRCPTDELLGSLALLLTAGNDTTVNLLGNGLSFLFGEPDARAAAADPSRIPALVEEMLRMDPPLHLDIRKTTRDVVLGGEEIPAGSLLWLVIAAANRDPRAFDDAGRFDPARSPEPAPHVPARLPPLHRRSAGPARRRDHLHPAAGAVPGHCARRRTRASSGGEQGGPRLADPAGAVLRWEAAARSTTRGCGMRWVTYDAGAGQRTGILDGETVRGLAAGTTLLDLLDRDELDEAGEGARRDPAEVLPLDGGPAARAAAASAVGARQPRLPRPPARLLQGARQAHRPARGLVPDAGVLLRQRRLDRRPARRRPGRPRVRDVRLRAGGRRRRRPRRPGPARGRRRAHIVGYTLFNDWSARDVQMRDMAQGIGMGKSKDSASTLGPALVTVDELEPHRRDGRLAFTLSATLNGEELTSGSLDAMDWTFGDMVAFASRGTDVVPGRRDRAPAPCPADACSSTSTPRTWRRPAGCSPATSCPCAARGSARHARPSCPAPRSSPCGPASRRDSMSDYTLGLHDLGARLPRLAAARRRLGLEQLRPDHRQRDQPDGRHAVRPRADPPDARGDPPGHRRPPGRTLVNTHSDGDHVHGNELLAARDVEIIASEAAAELITAGGGRRAGDAEEAARRARRVRPEGVRPVRVRGDHRDAAAPARSRGPRASTSAAGRCG